jgi:hypothetical protein
MGWLVAVRERKDRRRGDCARLFRDDEGGGVPMGPTEPHGEGGGGGEPAPSVPDQGETGTFEELPSEPAVKPSEPAVARKTSFHI